MYTFTKRGNRDLTFGIHRRNDEGELVQMSNFTAQIDEDVLYIDGNQKKSVYLVSGELDDEVLPAVEVDATQFPSLGWIGDLWGSMPVIFPGTANKDNLRAAIQTRNKATKRTVYLSTGWQIVKRPDGTEEEVYLHAGGAITKNGNDPSIRVSLPEDLKNYNLTTNEDEVSGMAASLELCNITRSGKAEDVDSPEIGWVLLALTYAPLFGPVDFGSHITGRSGTFKSELCGLMQGHYGPMDARSLPASWSSTGNANEALAYRTKNALMVVDDFVPIGTSQDKTKLNKAADQLFRGAGNQAGKARLTDRSNMQQTMYPRGVLLSTGEDTPEGHSVRGRIAIMELSPGAISAKELTKRQQQRKLYPAATVGLIKWLLKNPKRRQQVMDAKPKIRDKHLTIGHSRTPPMLGHLIAVIRMVLEYAAEIGAIQKSEKEAYKVVATDAILEMGSKQKQYLEQTDPAIVALESIRKLLGMGAGHFRTLSGGVPKMPAALGWKPMSESGNSGIPTYQSQGKKLGWVDWDRDEMYLDINMAYADMKRVSDQKLQLTQQTAIKRMREANMLARIEGSRNRNTIRVTAEGHPVVLVALRLSQVLQTNEVPQ
jgi:hypothetical protein